MTRRGDDLGPRAMLGCTGRPDLPLHRRPEWSPAWIVDAVARLAGMGYGVVEVRCLAGEMGHEHIPSAAPYALEKREREALEKLVGERWPLVDGATRPGVLVAPYVCHRLPASLRVGDLDMRGCVAFDWRNIRHRNYWRAQSEWWRATFGGVAWVLDNVTTGERADHAAAEALTELLLELGAEFVDWEGFRFDRAPTSITWTMVRAIDDSDAQVEWRIGHAPRPCQGSLGFLRRMDRRWVCEPPATWDGLGRERAWVVIDQPDATEKELRSLVDRGFGLVNCLWESDWINDLVLGADRKPRA